ncbi:MAG: rhodanese-like domain-containing protein [Pseudomonadota bacterium]
MPRPHLRSALRRFTQRVLGTSPPAPAAAPCPRPASELKGLPPLQPGRGETPGPNHKQDISREWASAQLLSGVPPYFIDIRPAEAWARGRIEGAHSFPGDAVRAQLEVLPATTERVVVYDDDGSEAAAALAAWLREQGWALARRLVGGFQGWEAHGEPTEAGAEG